MSTTYEDLKNPVKVADYDLLKDREPFYARVNKIDLVIIRYDENVSVLYGRCLHRGAILADGFVDGDNLICGVHNWDYRIDSGISAYSNSEILYKFKETLHEGGVYIDDKKTDSQVSAVIEQGQEFFIQSGQGADA